MKHLSALNASELRITSEHKDGSGVIEFPILRTHARIDLGRTATKDRSADFDTITKQDLAQAVINFAQWPGPVPIFRAPHRSMSESQGASDGFLQKLWVDDETLWAEAEITPNLLKEIKARQWRGFSVDYGRGANLATATLDGFLVAGGVFTNRPAADVHFRVAASGVDFISEVRSAFTKIGEIAEEEGMDKDIMVSLATAEAQAKSATDKLVVLSGKLEATVEAYSALEARYDTAANQVKVLSTENANLRVRLDSRAADSKELEAKINALEQTKSDLRVKLEAQGQEQIGTQVMALCRAAIKEGVPPAKIKELGDFENDPVAWLNGNFVSIDTAKQFLNNIPRVAALSAKRNGVADTDDALATMDPERIANLRALGLKPELAGIAKQAQLDELVDSGKLKK